jgi:hypothetical protein
MIHQQRGAGRAADRVMLGLVALAVAVTMVAAAAGTVAFEGFDARPKSIVVLAVIAAFAIALRRRKA